jgi:hypothetical protein
MSIPLPPSMTSKSKPVRVLAAVAAGSTALAGGLPLLTPDRFDWIGPAVGLLGLVITAAMAVYTEQNVTPWEDVAVKATPAGRLVAGPAAENLPNGAQVQVTGLSGQIVPGSATITPGRPVETVSNDPLEGDAL